MHIFPIPRKLNLNRKTIDFSEKNWIILPQNSGFPLKKRVMEIAQKMNGCFIHAPRVSAGLPAHTEPLIFMKRTAGIAAEGYKLTIPKNGTIQIEASDDAGFYYAMQTASQLLKKPDKCPCCKIIDEPSLKDRGYMLDVSRNKIPSMDTLKQLIKSLSCLRYNSLQFYMEHAFAFAAHERVWATYTPFTSEEIMELDACCREHFIELVPNLNSFGHLERWLCHSQYKNIAECDPPYILPETNQPMQRTLRPGKDALDFMDSLYSEFLPNFTSHKINIGCDETVELGQGKSKKLCERKGVHQVYLEFLTQLAARANKYGCAVEFWGDIILQQPDLINKLPKGITALEWGYEYDHPFEEEMRLFKKSGIDFLVCPGTSAWNTILGRTTNMTGNISKATACACKHGAKGMLLTDWGDKGHHQYYPISWPGIVMGGGAAWNASAKDTATEIPYGISLAFAHGGEGMRMGEFLMEIGRVYDDFTTRFHNSTAFGRIMTMYKELHKSKNCNPTKDYTLLQSSEVKKAMAHTKKLLKKLIQSPFEGYPLENAELENGLRMALVAMEFLNRAIGGKWNPSQWEDAMHHIIAQHEPLWLARNRVGGLYESSTYLRNFLAEDPDAWKKR